MAKNFDSTSNETYRQFLSNSVRSSIYKQPPRVNDVLNMINSLNLNKYVDHNTLSPYFLRVAFIILAPALCYFIDNAFSIKYVSLFKSGNTQSFTNYRPISILTCFAKIFEKLILRRLTTFFRKHSVLTKTQYGFQSDKFTSHAILDVLTAGYDNVKDNVYTGLCHV